MTRSLPHFDESRARFRGKVSAEEAAQNPVLIAAALYLQSHTDWTFDRAHDFMVVHYMGASYCDELVPWKPPEDESPPATEPEYQAEGIMPGTRMP